MDKRTPKLRTVYKSIPSFPLNKFPKDFPFTVGEQLIYILATRGETDIEGKEWEQIFANSIGAEWKPSNVGLDDIVLGNTAWGAKSVKHKNPAKQKTVRLISGRNDLQYSFQYTAKPGINADETGELVLNIYNERVSKIRETFKHLRTVVLIRSFDLTESMIFEFDTIRYDPELYYWKWNSRKNLMGFDKKDNKHKFTWQSGGTQFTIIEQVPGEQLIITVRKPRLIEKQYILSKIGFDSSWISVIKKNG
ncbi:MAG: hypothetical protein Q8M08_00775 [Bacteroidales bacterium]|nr:hypothetical protein [Bacteroidales bacterium]